MPLAKESISVYNPQDEWEKAIQDAYHASSDDGDWLPSFACQSIAKATANLKGLNNWLDNESLFFQRASYFFAPHMSSNKDKLVFSTFPLFLYDIMENNEIDAYLHDPITFVTLPIAHYLLRDYPVHIIVDYSVLRSDNHDADFLDVGGLVVVSGQNIKLSCASSSVLTSRSAPLQALCPYAVASVGELRPQRWC